MADTPTNKQNIMAAVEAWRTGKDPQSASVLYQYVTPTVNSALQSFASGDRSLRVPAYKLAFDAIKTYSPNKGADLRTHVYNNLQRLNRVSANRSSIVHIPEGVAKDYSTVSKALAELQDKYDREPTDNELADYTGLSVKRLKKILGGNNFITSSQGYSDEGGDAVTHKGISMDTYIDYLKQSCDPIDQKIIELSSGHRGSKIYSGTEIARRLNMTAPAVTQRMNKLRQRMDQLKGLL